MYGLSNEIIINPTIRRSVPLRIGRTSPAIPIQTTSIPILRCIILRKGTVIVYGVYIIW
jgi:hypothetical protein